MTHYNKLVRDKIPEIHDAKGIDYIKSIANDEDYFTELVKKLNEEIEEFNEDLSMEELADGIEVIESLKLLPRYTDVESVRKSKLEEKGGFEKRIILKGEK